MEQFNPLKKIQELAQKAREEGTVGQTPANIFKRGQQEQKKPVGVSLEEAEKIFGQDFLGPKAVEAVFTIPLAESAIVPIPFSREELENAKALGQQLIFQAHAMMTDYNPIDGNIVEAITLKNLKERFVVASDGNATWYEQNWYNNEEFFSEKMPQPCWRLTSKDVIHGSNGKNYLEQTEILISHLRNEVFMGIELPKQYAEAIEEFEREKELIAECMKKDWKEASHWLASLKITKLTRETPVEVMYRLILQEQTNKKRSLSNRFTWTSRCSLSGELVFVGHFNSDGVVVTNNVPDLSYITNGVCFSRTK